MPKTSEKKYTVRRLNANDLFKVTKIMASVLEDLRESMKGMDMDKANNQVVGFMFIEAAMQGADEELANWLADLVGKTPEEFEELPFDAPLDIMHILADQEDLKDFFGKAQSLMKKFTGK